MGAVAHEAALREQASGQHIEIYNVSLADVKDGLYGSSEKILQGVFNVARSTKPSIIAIDEIDVLGGMRNEGHHQIDNSLVTVLLTNMEGLKKDELITVIGSTNRPQSIDEALKRPGRFDVLATFSLPNEKQRRAIFEQKMNKARKLQKWSYQLRVV